MDAPGKQRGQVIISRQRPHKTGFADHVVNLGGQLPLGGGDLCVGGVGGGLEFGLLRLQLVLLSGQLVDEGAHLRLLRFQVCLRRLLFLFGGLLGLTGGFQLRLVLLNLLPQGNELVHDLVVIVHDLLHHHGVVQQVRKVLGGEQDGPVGDLPLLLHIPHPLAEQLVLGLLLRLRLAELLLLLGNELIVFGDLGGNGIDLRLGGVDLLLQQGLALHGVGLILL